MRRHTAESVGRRHTAESVGRRHTAESVVRRQTHVVRRHTHESVVRRHTHEKPKWNQMTCHSPAISAQAVLYTENKKSVTLSRR